MKNIIALFFSLLSASLAASGQKLPIDSIRMVSIDAGGTYISFVSDRVSDMKELLDDREFWPYYFKDSSDIAFRCIWKRKKLIHKFEKLWQQCGTSNYVDLSNFSRIIVRVGLKIYRGKETEYLFIQTKSSDYFDKFMITEHKEWHTSNALVRFLKKMKRPARCRRC